MCIVRVRLMGAFLAAEPLGCAMLIIVAVGKHLVAQRTEGGAFLVVAALQTGEGIVVAMDRQQTNDAQRLQLIMDVAQDRFVAFTGVTQEFPDLEIGEAGAQAFEAGTVSKWSANSVRPTLAGVQGPVSGQSWKRRSSTILKALDL